MVILEAIQAHGLFQATVEIILPKVSIMKSLQCDVYIDERDDDSYDIILGNDFLAGICIDLVCS